MYPIETRLASKAGWSTPQEAMQIWKRYSREGVTIHWWGDGTGASNHDNIVNYFLSQASKGIKSVNYVVSDNKITLVVSPDNVAWCSNGGNPTTISIEHQPTLGAEGYKKSGWLVWQLEQRYGRKLNFYPHSHWTSTQCPGSIDMGRIRAEANKWASGGYNPPVVVPPVASAPNIKITYSKLPTPIEYIVNKNTDLWDFNTASWAGFVSKKKLIKGEKFVVYAIADNQTLHAKYGMTQYSYGTNDAVAPRFTHGVNMVDLDLPVKPVQPIHVPPPVQVQPPTPPSPAPEPSVPISVLEKFWAEVTRLWTAMLDQFRRK